MNAQTRTTLGIGLAFVTGILVFFVVIQVMNRFQGERPEPLTPVAERKPGDFQAHYFKPAGDPEWRLKDQLGKVVVVNLFATWCGPCREELPELKSLAREYAPKGVVFVSLSLDQDGDVLNRPRAEVLGDFITREDLPFPVLIPAKGSMMWQTGNIPIPQTFLYDKQGRSARTIVGSIEKRGLRSSLDELLKE